MLSSGDSSSPRRIALVIETSRAYGRRIIEGVMRFMREHEPWIIEMEPRSLEDPLPAHLRRLPLDGVIARLVHPASLRWLARAPCPVVHLKATLPGSKREPGVGPDQLAIGSMAAQHFLERGFRHFGFAGVPGNAWSDLRLKGFREALAARGAEVKGYRRTNKSRISIEGLPLPDPDRLARWLQDLPRPCAVLAADDFIGVRILNTCRLNGIAVPEDIAVVGVDDEEALCRFASPPLTSVIPDNWRVGYEAARLLRDRMNGLTDPHFAPIRIPPKGIVIRASSDTVAVDDSQVARAMAFIRKNACRKITVREVSRHVGLAPASLQRRFQSALGCPVYEAALRERIHVVRGLLTDTELPLKEIAFRAGFTHTEHLATLFRNRTGVTMLSLRRGVR